MPAVAASATSGSLPIDTDTTLVEDHYGPIEILTSNVTLNCDGFSVIGSGEDAGILIEEKAGVTVKNCHVSGFSIGFHIRYSSHSTLMRNTSSNNDAGFQIDDDSHKNVLHHNEASGNFVGFVAVTNSDDNRLIANFSHHNEFGFLVAEESDGNMLIRNRATDNVIGVAAFSNSPGTRLIRNTICNTDVNVDYEDDSEPIMIKNEICDIGEGE